jgi:hypothetical protein
MPGIEHLAQMKPLRVAKKTSEPLEICKLSRKREPREGNGEIVE